MSVTDLIQGNDLVNGYRILNKIGEGNGVVYRARKAGSEVDLAVKFVEPVRSSTGLDLKKTMENERRIHNILGSHDRIAGVVADFEFTRSYPGGRETRLLANVYEYVPPVPTDKLISGTLSVEELIIIGYDIAKAFAHTHGKGIVHADMKPHNILVDENTGRAKLADFGIAAVVSELPSITDPIWDIPVGTAAYMSPEQICGQNISYPSDLYSFGAALYHMLTGQMPVEGETALEIRQNLQCRKENRNYELRSDVPRELEWALRDLGKTISSLREGNRNHRPDAPEALSWFKILKHDLAA